jgi:hypothetical protein
MIEINLTECKGGFNGGFGKKVAIFTPCTTLLIKTLPATTVLCPLVRGAAL